MDELGFNKIAAAVLATGLGFWALNLISHSAVHADKPEKPAYALAIPEATGPEEEIILPFPQPEWVNAMDAERGARVFAKCTSCHNAEDGGANGTGPNLWNIVGNAAGQKAGFNYSSAMANAGLVWTFETLEGYLEKPTRYLQGTNMNFVGLRKPEDRAAVIEYLRVASPAPIDRPDPILVEAEVETAEDGVTEVIEAGEGAVQDATGEVIDNAEGDVPAVEADTNPETEDAPVEDATSDE